MLMWNYAYKNLHLTPQMSVLCGKNLLTIGTGVNHFEINHNEQGLGVVVVNPYLDLECTRTSGKDRLLTKSVTNISRQQGNHWNLTKLQREHFLFCRPTVILVKKKSSDFYN